MSESSLLIGSTRPERLVPRRTPVHNNQPTPGKKLRARVRHAALTHAPVWLSGGRLARVKPHKLHITYRSIALPRLPRRLDGLTIAHLSDLHIGKLTTVEHLPLIVQATNDLHADLIAITGDFVDLSLSVLDDLQSALLKLRAPLGVHLVPGNHDYLDDGPRLFDSLSSAGLSVLINRSLTLDHRKSRVRIAGIDWASETAHLEAMVRSTLSGAPMRDADVDGDEFRLLLAHHPHAFDAAAAMQVDLTLAGHTHGGQVVLKHPGKRSAVALGSLAFQYTRGVYHQGPSALHVTTGIGSWFPLRVRCPAEIALLTLRRENP
jgi:predicted MPP superfamily phosphohydrolase